jgi:hypothetical protein
VRTAAVEDEQDLFVKKLKVETMGNQARCDKKTRR